MGNRGMSAADDLSGLYQKTGVIRPDPTLGRDLSQWLRSYESRTSRLEVLIALAEQRGSPRFLVSTEIDLVRQALDALDLLIGDRATRDGIVAERAR
jgi:hypothetical protein